MDEGATLSPSSSFSSCSSTRNYKYDEQTLYTSCSGRQRTNERTVRMVENEWPTSFHYVALYSNLNSKSASFRPHVPFEKFIVEAWNHTSNGRRMDGWVGGWQMSCYAMLGSISIVIWSFYSPSHQLIASQLWIGPIDEWKKGHQCPRWGW